MFNLYKPIVNDIYKTHLLIEFLVINVWCKADNKQCRIKLNDELKAIYDKHSWFKKQVSGIYSVCKKLTLAEKNTLKTVFENNNKIEELCNGTIKPIPLSSLNNDLLAAIEPFFEKLYTKFLGWKIIYSKYGTKKSYYNALLIANGFKFCPCCGFGDIKDYYSSGYSPFDHYLPQKHYPLSTVNFNNLAPMCHICNSDYKGETDILLGGQIVYYPFGVGHKIEVLVTVDKNSLTNLITQIEESGKMLDPKEIKVDFDLKDNRIDSWDKIFKIKDRYFGKIAINRVSWLDDVRKVYRDPQIIADTYEKAFDKVIELDSEKHLGFLKAAYLKNLKSYGSLVKAMDEVSGTSVIKK
jgi:hypothetical protein